MVLNWIFRFAQDKTNFDKVYTSILTSITITSTVFIGLLILFLKPIANVMQYGEHPEYILWLGLIVALDAIISIPFAKLRLQNKAGNLQ
jgi:hypothetical protein